MKLLLGSAALALTLSFASANAATVVVNTDNTVQLQTAALTGFQTNGDDMDGMSVTATFASGFSQTLAWADTGANAGAVSGTGWGLSVNGDTFSNNIWNFSNSRIDANGRSELLVSLDIDAGVGDTVFDIINDGPSTPGSANGKPFDTSAGGDGTITATYFDSVALTGDAAVGDLFARLSVDFSGLTANGLGGAWTFTADTDNLSLSGDLTPVPVPAPLALFLTGLVGLGIIGRRRRKTAD